MNQTGIGLDWSGLIGLLIIAGIFGFGGGFGFNGGTGTALGLADIQASLYNQTQDANSRQMQNQIAMVNDSILNNKYDNAILVKDLSNQLSNSIAGISNQISNQTSTILGVMTENTINELRDKLAVTRDELSNVRQSAYITDSILSSLATIAPKPPCNYPYCQCSSTTTGGATA